MYKAKHNLNPRVFDNTFTEIHHRYPTRFTRSNFKQPKIITKTTSFVISSPTNTDKIFDKNSSFHVKSRTTGKVQFLFSRSLLLALTKFSFWEEDWALSYTSTKF